MSAAEQGIAKSKERYQLVPRVLCSEAAGTGDCLFEEEGG